MKTAVVLSDTHGNRRAIDEISGILAENNYIIHLGDTSGDGGYIRSLFPGKTFLANGNCDPVKLGEDELVIEIEGVKLLAVHGHTHCAREDVINGVTLINPGAFTKYCQKSYLYLAFAGGKFTSKIVLV